MPTIRTRIFGPGKEGIKRKKVDPAVHKRLISLFKEMMAKQGNSPRMYIDGKGFEKTYLDMRKPGRSSAIVVWKRQDGGGKKMSDKAVSVLMGSEDEAADKQVMNALRKLGKALPFPAGIYDEIEKDKRPIMATLYLDEMTLKDPILPIAADCLSVAFFEPMILEQAIKSGVVKVRPKGLSSGKSAS